METIKNLSEITPQDLSALERLIGAPLDPSRHQAVVVRVLPLASPTLESAEGASLDAATIVNRFFAFQDMESRVQELEAVTAIVRQLITGPAFAAEPSKGIFTTFITSLGSEEFILRKPIPVTIFPDDDEFTASFMDANISTGGGSPREALYNLQHLIAEFFAMDEEDPDVAVSNKMRHQRLVLAECVCRSSRKTMPTG